MSFLKNRPTWDVGPNGITVGDLHKVEGAVDRTIARAIQDATQSANLALQLEAAAWLWVCCPDIAEQLDLPEVRYDAVPGLAAGYVNDEAETASPWPM